VLRNDYIDDHHHHESVPEINLIQTPNNVELRQEHDDDQSTNCTTIHNLPSICLVSDFIDRDLTSLLGDEQIDFGEEYMMKVLYHCLCDIAFLHEANVVHQNINPVNILIS